MKVLVACEFSGVVREAFRKRGHDAWSCDLLNADDKSEYHYKSSVFHVLLMHDFDLMIAHPPCTRLCSSGARWFNLYKDEQDNAILFFMQLVNAKVNKICIENPIGIMSKRYRKPDQIIQPWMFGHGETKATCLWLKNLEPLEPTKIVEGREARIHKMPPSKDRGKLRSITYQGIANAMAEQWG